MLLLFSCPAMSTLCDPDCSTPGLPCPLYYLLEFAQVCSLPRWCHLQPSPSWCPVLLWLPPASIRTFPMRFTSDQNTWVSVQHRALREYWGWSCQNWLVWSSQSMDFVYLPAPQPSASLLSVLPSLQSSRHNCTWPAKTTALTVRTCRQYNVSAFQIFTAQGLSSLFCQEIITFRLWATITIRHIRVRNIYIRPYFLLSFPLSICHAAFGMGMPHFSF